MGVPFANEGFPFIGVAVGITLITAWLGWTPVAIAAGLWACGDYVEGPYPATLEGAVRAGVAVARQLGA